MENHGILSDSLLPPSSPMTMPSPASDLPLPQSPTRTTRRKPRGNPSITPRRFGRFFTPRSALNGGGRTILGSLSAAAVNSNANSFPLSPESLANDPLSSDPIYPSPSDRPGQSRKRKDNDQHQAAEPVIKRRGFLLQDIPMPQPDFGKPNVENTGSRDVKMATKLGQEDILGQKRKAVLNHFFMAPRGSSRMQDLPVSDVTVEEPPYQPRPIRKFGNRGFEAQLLDREHGYSRRDGRQHLSLPAYDTRIQTETFYSNSSDLVHCESRDGPGNTIPFCLASFHRAPLTAIGDEEGCVRFLATNGMFSNNEKTSSQVRVHDNAIMDLSISNDDMRLATACGDRTAKIVDVTTMAVAVNLSTGSDQAHEDTLRQVAFQPGQANGSVLATSDRAGRIQVWDLRCSAVPVNNFSTPKPNRYLRNLNLAPGYAQVVNTIDNAHLRTAQGNVSSASVTAIQWLNPGREHLLLSASEANASIKLWDTRYIKPRRQAGETPLAATPQPSTHTWRTYGITSLALSGDAARLYAVCRDSTVYAYSVPHLMLGHAPELLDGAYKRRPTGAEGMGPLYGLRHDKFSARSFFIKSAIRPAGPNGSAELLAVGSSSSCAMLFPLDERHMRTAWGQRSHLLDSSFTSSTPNSSFSSAPATPSASFSGPSSSSLPIFRVGTPLVHGHEREVAIPSWTCEGKLVTASDDSVVRHWQQDDGTRARYLRRVGEFGGERHMAGWAEVEDEWDDDEDES
jgi:WD40 repeat protein